MSDTLLFLLAFGGVAIAARLAWQLRTVRRSIEDLVSATRRRDMEWLGSANPKSRPEYIRELEVEVFEQLFKGEKLVHRVERRDMLLASVVEGLGDAVIVIDRNSRIRFVNATAIELFHWQSNPVEQKTVHAIANEQLLLLLSQCFATKRPVSDTLVFESPHFDDRAERILEVDIAPLERTDNNAITRVRMVLRDITERTELEQLRRDFVANASHELRTPMTIINGYLENLAEVDWKPEEARRVIATMQKHSGRLVRLIEDMMTISKLESKISDLLQMVHFDLGEVCREVIEQLQPTADAKKATLTWQTDSNSAPMLYGDPFYWNQILFNLVENALKENDAAGLKVEIFIKKIERAGWEITVTDNGRGIPRSDLPFVFKRFFRGDRHHNSGKEGTGLGLSIVRRAVAAHGGTIEVHSTQNVRTSFLIKLPEIPVASQPPATE